MDFSYTAQHEDSLNNIKAHVSFALTFHMSLAYDVQIVVAFPVVARYQDQWPVEMMLKQYLENQMSYRIKKVNTC